MQHSFGGAPYTWRASCRKLQGEAGGAEQPARKGSIVSEDVGNDLANDVADNLAVCH